MSKAKPRVIATRHFPPDVEARLAENFDALLNPEDRLYDGPALAQASAGFDGIMCAAGDARQMVAPRGSCAARHDRRVSRAWASSARMA